MGNTSGPLDQQATLVVQALYEGIVAGQASASVWIVHPNRTLDAALEKRVRPWLVWPRGEVTYTLAAHNTGNRLLKDGVLVDEVPPGIEVLEAGGGVYDPQARELRWEIGQLKPGQETAVTVLAQVAEGVEMAVVRNSAAFTATSTPARSVTATAEAALYVGGVITGIIPPSGGTLTILDGLTSLTFPPGAVPVTVVVTVKLPVDLPAPMPESMIYRDYAFDVQLHTLATGAPITTTLRPVTITVQYAQLPGIGETATPYGLRLYRYDEAAQAWGHVPVWGSPQAGVLEAATDRFSTLAAGQEGQPWKPVFVQPAVALFSGAATYHYPIQVAPGRGGLQPNVTLAYNSRSVEGHGWTGGADFGPVGMGWSIEVLDIVRDDWAGGQCKVKNPQNEWEERLWYCYREALR